MKTIITFLISGISFLTSCNQQGKNTSKPDKLILRFEIGSNGKITDEKAKEEVLALGKKLQESADKMVLSSYTEQSGSIEQDEKTAKEMAHAVRELLKTQGERNATNVAVEIKGFENPIDPAHPENIINRRIEIVPM